MKPQRSLGWTAACVVSPETVLSYVAGLLVDIDLAPNLLKCQGFLDKVDE